MNYKPDENTYESLSENDYSFGQLCGEIAKLQFQEEICLSDVKALELVWYDMRSSISEDVQNVTDNVLFSLRTRALVDQ